MVTTQCPKCGSKEFEIRTPVQGNTNLKLMFVQCAKCEYRPSIKKFYNLGSLLNKVAKAKAYRGKA
jgi:predicted nucleic-acid-binding Zn-ribbon protein